MTRKEILEAAEKCVCGDRDRQYGSPENSFTAIADLWNAFLWAREEPGDLLTAADVAAMMVLFKVGRIATGQNKDDNWVDIAGYAACGGEVSNSEQI